MVDTDPRSWWACSRVTEDEAVSNYLSAEETVKSEQKEERWSVKKKQKEERWSVKKEQREERWSVKKGQKEERWSVKQRTQTKQTRIAKKSVLIAKETGSHRLSSPSVPHWS